MPKMATLQMPAWKPCWLPGSCCIVPTAGTLSPPGLSELRGVIRESGELIVMVRTQGNLRLHQYQVCGRHLPSEQDPEPTVWRMKLFAPDPVRAKSKFWYFLRKLRKIKKAHGQVLAVNEIFEKKPTTIKNFGIWLRYQSRTGYHNMYKEYRDVTLNGAVEQMYTEMGSRHRARPPVIQIIKTATVPPALCKRDSVKQFHDSKIKFPLTRRSIRPSDRKYKTVFKAVRPNAAMF